MAESTTTLELLQRNARLNPFEILEIKRRFSFGIEADWFDVSNFLVFTTAAKVSQRLDFESFGYGQFKTGSASFTLDNSQGAFNNELDLYSLFSGTLARHYTRVRFRAGYKDEDGDNLNEVVFQGLINGKTIKPNFDAGQITIEVLAFEQILSERTISVGTITNTLASSVIADIFNADSTITDFINFSTGNINPGTDITFDDATKFENKKVAVVLNDIAKKTNSTWLVDSSQNIIFRDKDVNAGSPFEFVGGNQQKRETNISKIESVDDGFTKIINQVKYDSGGTVTITSASGLNLERFGTNELPLSGEDLTTGATITAVSNDIINDNSEPKKRVILSTVYMPNVIDFLDPCSIDYKPAIILQGQKGLIFNDQKSTFNEDFFFGIFENRNIFLPAIAYKYFGFDHNTKEGKTRHYLIEN